MKAFLDSCYKNISIWDMMFELSKKYKAPAFVRITRGYEVMIKNHKYTMNKNKTYFTKTKKLKNLEIIFGYKVSTDKKIILKDLVIYNTKKYIALVLKGRHYKHRYQVIRNKNLDVLEGMTYLGLLS